MAFATKRIIAALLCVALLFMLCACGNDPSPATTTIATEPATQVPTQTTTQPETTAVPLPSYSFAPIPGTESPGQSHEPLRGGEMAIERASINDIVERFGAYEGYKAGLYPEIDAAIVELKYPNMIVEISYGYEALSFGGGDDNRRTSDEEPQPELTKADKAVTGWLRRLCWTDKSIDLTAPRGLEIGDSEEKVLRSYLDLRTKYGDTDNPWRARVIYEWADSVAPDASDGFSSSGCYRIYEDEGYPPPVPCDYSIGYGSSDMSYMLEGTEYYIRDHVVVAIKQHRVDAD